MVESNFILCFNEVSLAISFAVVKHVDDLCEHIEISWLKSIYFLDLWRNKTIIIHNEQITVADTWICFHQWWTDKSFIIIIGGNIQIKSNDWN